MTAPAFRSGPALEPPPWTVEAGEAAGWAARQLAQTLAVVAAWPLRMAWRALHALRWGTGETIMSTAVLGLPFLLLLRLLPRVHWPTAAQMVADLQRVAVVLAVAYLLLATARVRHGRACCGHRHLVPSPDGTKTWRWIVAVHEAAHLVIGKRLGRRTGKARILGGGGFTDVFPDHDDITGEIAIDMAGGIAAGTQAGCDGDRANARWRLRRFVEPKRRGGVMTAGTAKARAMVAHHRPEIDRTARTIYRKGWAR